MSLSNGDIPAPHRRIHFVGSNDTSDAARGRVLFEEQARLMPDHFRVGREYFEETDRCCLHVVLMPASVGIADRLEHTAGLPCSCRSIVDVHADFWVAGDHLKGAAEWWRADGRIAALERCVRAADLVTIPDGGYLDSVAKLNPNVAIVPDCPDGELTEEVAVGWTAAVMAACAHAHPGHRLALETMPTPEESDSDG